MIQDAIDLKKVPRALVVALRHHGDVPRTLPAIEVLKNQPPHVAMGARPFVAA